MNFDIHILGSNSALPTLKRFSSCQVVNFREKLFMIDCGEGAQIQMRRQRLKYSRLNHIFLSHLHGDHIFGLPGLLSTLGLLNRTSDLHIYAPADLETVLMPFLNAFTHQLPYKLMFHIVDPKAHAPIYSDRSLEVWTIPLSHKVPCCGYLFKEKPVQRNLKKDMVECYKLSIKDIKSIKEGNDYITSDGKLIPNSMLTVSLHEPRSFAYCSDTRFFPQIADCITGADLLYHEATFANDQDLKLSRTWHSTSAQAAEIAKRANVKKLIMGHFSARYDDLSELLNNAKMVFENSVLVDDGMKISI